jgi:hypothetical protein
MYTYTNIANLKNTDLPYTKGAKKYSIYLNDFIYSNYFETEKKRLRKKYDIPELGLPFKKEDEIKLKKEGLFYLPRSIKAADEEKVFLGLNRDIAEVIKTKLPTNDLWLIFYMKILVLHTDIKEKVLNEFLKNIIHPDLCFLSNSKLELDSYVPALEKFFMKPFITHLREELALYPLSIKFNPNITQNQLIDFIKKNWSRIRTLSSEYPQNIALKKAKTRILFKRNKEILKYKNLTARQIKEKLKKSWPNLSTWDIRKAKSLERKRRTQV